MNDRTTSPADSTTDSKDDSENDSRFSSGVGSAIGSGLARKALEPLIRAVKEELASARKEIADRVSGARTGLILVVAGALIGLVSLGLVAALAVILLALVLPLWGAAAITLGVFMLVTALLLVVGLRGIRRGVPPIPKDTLARNRPGGKHSDQ